MPRKPVAWLACECHCGSQTFRYGLIIGEPARFACPSCERVVGPEPLVFRCSECDCAVCARCMTKSLADALDKKSEPVVGEKAYH